MPIVIVNKLNDDAAGLCHQFLGTFESMGLSLDFDKSKAIFIKPNLTYPNFKEGVTTRRDFVAALVAALRDINKTTKIYIGEIIMCLMKSSVRSAMSLNSAMRS